MFSSPVIHILLLNRLSGIYFIIDFLNSILNVSNYTPVHDGKVKETASGTVCWRKLPWLKFIRYPGTCIEDTEKNHGKAQ
jgi:hypothetical protein